MLDKLQEGFRCLSDAAAVYIGDPRTNGYYDFAHGLKCTVFMLCTLQNILRCVVDVLCESESEKPASGEMCCTLDAGVRIDANSKRGLDFFKELHEKINFDP
jgi:hypothetical protein